MQPAESQADQRAGISKDTQLCISLAARPSNIGTRFHNKLYELLGLDFVYKAFAPTDIVNAVAGIRGLPIRGAAVSMPYKETVIGLIDELDESANAIQSVNTIVNDGGRLKGFNTDFVAVQTLLRQAGVRSTHRVVVHGSGGMAKAVAAAVASLGVTDCVVVARNESQGRALGLKYFATSPLSWAPTVESIDSSAVYDVLINATPIGMAGGGPESEALSFPENIVKRADIVMDVVAMPRDTPLIRLAESLGKKVVSGSEVMTDQAVAQFCLYTGVRPTQDDINIAAAHARRS